MHVRECEVGLVCINVTHMRWKYMMMIRSRWILATKIFSNNGLLDIRVCMMNQWLTLFPVTHYCGCDVQKKWFSKNSRHTREQPSERKKRKKMLGNKLKCKIKQRNTKTRISRVIWAKAKLHRSVIALFSWRKIVAKLSCCAKMNKLMWWWASQTPIWRTKIIIISNEWRGVLAVERLLSNFLFFTLNYMRPEFKKSYKNCLSSTVEKGDRTLWVRFLSISFLPCVKFGDIYQN